MIRVGQTLRCPQWAEVGGKIEYLLIGNTDALAQPVKVIAVAMAPVVAHS